jgi:hypothetical protein
MTPVSWILARCVAQPCGRRGRELGILITADDTSSVPLCHSTSRLPKLFDQFTHRHTKPLDPDKPKNLPSPDNLWITAQNVQSGAWHVYRL